ncbi:VanZ family protein [Paenibacillus sp. MWE-103]|uniref:VanZ family protein n=1 Tax=Paenibacillus artemisiicola TaxID=1172618 RepID=A0ABS3WHS4_9BACL|nr:VanZ family protein [Paenibacillus artemisiicola]MBO7747793.1 VanZ family protein [Paenibacillus artemisiicola]
METKMIHRLFIAIPLLVLLAWIVIVFLLSSESYQEQSLLPFLHRTFTAHMLQKILPTINFEYHHAKYSSQSDPYALLEFLFRKCAHLFMYAMLAILAAFALGVTKRPVYRLLLPLIIVALIASLDELNQKRIPGRTSNPQDILIDLTGGCIGILIYYLSHYVYRRIRYPKGS